MATRSKHSKSFTKCLLPVLILCITVSFLIALGCWQLQRLSWKRSLIAEIQASTSLPPLTMDQCHPHETDFGALRFRKLSLRGTFMPHQALYLYAGPREFKGESGYRLLTPFACEKGGMLLVDRGWIPEDYRQVPVKIFVPEGAVTIEGMLMPEEHAAFFTPTNDISRNMWYWIDIPTISATTHHDFPPFYVMQAPETREAIHARYPLGKDAAAIPIRNHHLQYAFTWFSTAVIAVIIFLLYARQQRGPQPASTKTKEGG